MKSLLTLSAVLTVTLTLTGFSAEPIDLLSGGLDAWESKDGSAPGAGWVLKDGVLHRADKTGDIVTKEEFSSFEFEWEWKIAEGANSGVKYWVTPIKGQMLGIEYQIIDDAKHEDALKNADHTVGCIYDLVEASADKPVRAPGEWNTSKIVVRDGKIEQWLNGKMVAALDTNSEDYKARFAKSKYVKFEGFSPGHGKLLLQDHGDEVWFRNLRVTRL